MRIRLNGEIKEIRALWIEDKERGIVKFLFGAFNISKKFNCGLTRRRVV